MNFFWKRAIVLIVLPGCMATHKLKEVKVNTYKNGPIYFICIPNNYKFQSLIYGTSNFENRYIYPDSSMIYISNIDYPPNTQNIMKLGDSIYDFRFQEVMVVKTIVDKSEGKKVPLPLPETVDFIGIDMNNNYWKERKIKNTYIGYLNVAKEQKAFYDKILDSFRSKSSLLRSVY